MPIPGHAKIVIAEYMIAISLEHIINRHHICKTLEVSIDEVAEVHDESQLEPIKLLNALRQFCR